MNIIELVTGNATVIVIDDKCLHERKLRKQLSDFLVFPKSLVKFTVSTNEGN